MKKTLIALVALSGMAMADATQDMTWYQDLSTTLPAATTIDGLQISAWTGVYTATDGTTSDVTLVENNTSTYSAGQLVCYNPSVLEAYNTTSAVTYSFTLTNNTDKAITLSDVSTTVYATSNGGANQGGPRSGKLTLTMGETTYGAVAISVASGATPTISVENLGVELAAGESVNVAMQFKNDGNSPRWFLGLGDVTWKGTTTVPEPATATLSLLALAGLAARRRRH